MFYGQEKLAEVAQPFTTLYSSDLAIVANDEQRCTILQLIQPTLSHQDNFVLSCPPSEEEVCSVVLQFKREKAPGLDGVIAQMLQLCWDFMHIAC